MSRPTLADLELRFDGRIPAGALDAADPGPLPAPGPDLAVVDAEIAAAGRSAAALDEIAEARAVLAAAARGEGRAQVRLSSGRLETIGLLPHVIRRAESRLRW